MERIAVYPGTFDPITNGHLDILTRAAKLFDKVILAVAVDNYKNTIFNTEKRFELASKSVCHLENVEVVIFKGLLVDFCEHQHATAIIRGLRALSDFEKEFQMALMNKDVAPEIESVFLMTEPEYMYVSSSLVRDFAALGVIKANLVPRVVEVALQERFCV